MDVNDRYRIKELWSTTTFFALFTAKDRSTGELVMFKVWRGIGAGEELLLTELRQLRRLRHANLIELREAGRIMTVEPEPAAEYATVLAPGHLFLVTEFVASGDILTYADRRHPLTTESGLAARVALLLQAAEGLAYIHGQRCVHGDIKPANVLVQQDGTVKLIDFGFTAQQGIASPESLRGWTTAYAAPEVLFGQGWIDHRADQYALGVLAWQLLAGVHPFQALLDRPDSQARDLLTEPEPIWPLTSDVGRALGWIVMRMTARHAAARFTSLRELLPGLRQIAGAAAAGGGSRLRTTQVLSFPGLVGREKELKRLREFIASVANGLALINAPSGTGGSRLLRELETLAMELALPALFFDGRSRTRGWRHWSESLGALWNVPAEQRSMAKIASVIVSGLPSHPALILIDHWESAPQDWRDVVELLARRAEQSNFKVILVAREPINLLTPRLAITLTPLLPADTRALIRSFLSVAELGVPLENKLATACDGLPDRIERLLQRLLADGVLSADGGKWCLSADAPPITSWPALSMPPPSFLAELTVDERIVLEVFALAMLPLSVSDVVHVTGLDTGRAEAALFKLCRDEFVLQTEITSDNYLFTLRDAELKNQVAAGDWHLEPEVARRNLGALWRTRPLPNEAEPLMQLAQCFLADGAPELAFQAYRQSAEAWSKKKKSAQALEALTRAADLLHVSCNEAERADFLKCYAQTAMSAKDYTLALKLTEQILAEYSEQAAPVELLLMKGQILSKLNLHDAAGEVYDALLNRQDALPMHVIEVKWGQAWTALHTGREEQALAQMPTLIEKIKAATDQSQLQPAINDWAAMLMGMRRYQHAREIWATAGPISQWKLSALINGAQTAVRLGDFTGAEQMLAEAEARLTADSPPSTMIVAKLTRGNLDLELNRLNEAYAAYQQALDKAIAAADLERQIAALHGLGCLFRRRGDAAAAMTYLEQAQILARGYRGLEYQPRIALELAKAAASEHGTQDAAAADILQQAIQQLPSTAGIEEEIAEGLALIALYKWRGIEEVAARALANQAVAQLKQVVPSAWTNFETLAARRLLVRFALESDDIPLAKDQIDGITSALFAVGRPADLARDLLELGQAHAVHPEARQLQLSWLFEAQRLFQQAGDGLGAQAADQAIRQQLPARGGDRLWEFLKQRISSLVAQLDEPETACRELIRIVQFLSGAERVALILYTPGQPHPPFWSENVKSEQRRYIRSVEKIVRSTGKEYFNEDPLLDPNLRDKASVLAVRPSYVFGMPIRVPGGEPTLAGFLYLDDTKPYAILSEPVRREIRQLSAELAKQLLSEGAARARAPEGGDVPASVPRLIHGPNSPLKDIRERIKLFASYKRQVPVIILGESGTGKDIVANQLHYWRFHHYHPRSNAPFYAVNCGALEPSLITSSLFGHLKGSYTGATMSRKGMIDAADGGTLFIDEIGVMPPEGQAKLLRFLEDSKVCPIGGTVPHDVDAWLVSATNEDLVARAHERLFRSDLLSRLHLAVINLPPLRDRPAADFEALTIHFCRSEAAGIGIEPPRISSEAWEKLRSHNWPLNVRELKNCITRAFLLSRNQTIKAGHIEFLFTTRPPQNAVRGELTVMTADVVQPWETAMIEHEKALIINALDKCNGSVDKAAKLLGIASQTAHKKIKAYGLEDCKRSSGAASRRAFLSNYQRVISRLWRPNEE